MYSLEDFPTRNFIPDLHSSCKGVKNSGESELSEKTKIYQMIHFLFEENKKLNKEIEKLKTSCRNTKRKVISEWINEEKNKSKVLWKDYSDSVNREHLLELFENTRVSSFKKIISDNKIGRAHV